MHWSGHVCDGCPAAHEVLPGLWLGSAIAARDPEAPYTHVVSLGVDPPFPGPGRTYLDLAHLLDMPQVDLLAELPSCVSFLRSALAVGRVCLVHCVYGQSRSATVVTAYVMAAMGWDADTALAFVRDRRPCIGVNPGFQFQLRLFGQLRRLPAPIRKDSPPGATYRFLSLAALRTRRGQRCQGFSFPPPGDATTPMFVAACADTAVPPLPCTPGAARPIPDEGKGCMIRPGTSSAGVGSQTGPDSGDAGAAGAAGAGASAAGVGTPKLMAAAAEATSAPPPVRAYSAAHKVLIGGASYPRTWMLACGKCDAELCCVSSVVLVPHRAVPSVLEGTRCGTGGARAGAGTSTSVSTSTGAAAAHPSLSMAVEEDGQAASAGHSTASCSMVFVEPGAWMAPGLGFPDSVLQTDEGRIMCPGAGCAQRLGAWSWSAPTQCACGLQVAPAFALSSARLAVRAPVM